MSDRAQENGAGRDLDAEAARINAWFDAAQSARRSAETRPPFDRGPRESPTVVHVCARCGWTWRAFRGVDPKSCPHCRSRGWRTPIPPRVSDTVRVCLHCGHEWRARKAARPCACPACASTNWDRPPKFRWRMVQKNQKRTPENGENGVK